MSLGKRLKQQRELKGWSQIFVASKIGITNTVLSNYERDYRDPDTETLSKLADLYETSADYLLKGEYSSTNNVSPFKGEPSKTTERDYHLFDTDGVQFIARSDKNLSPAAYKKMQELAKKAAELFDEEDED